LYLETPTQVWNFPNLKFMENKDLSKLSADTMRQHCQVAVKDLMDMKQAPPDVELSQICFEDLLYHPREAASHVYSQLEGFRDWDNEGDTEFPRGVEEYGTRHVAGWANVTHEVQNPKTLNPKPGQDAILRQTLSPKP
jgi:hypothetical protein